MVVRLLLAQEAGVQFPTETFFLCLADGYFYGDPHWAQVGPGTFLGQKWGTEKDGFPQEMVPQGG